MMDIRTILVPTDFSASSEVALELACSTARAQGARLVLLHVAAFEMTEAGMMAVVMDPSYYKDALREFQDRVVGPSPGFPVETSVREGTAAEEILRAADDVGADLIVMGSHGRTGLGRLLMGSVAEEVTRRAECPVLLAKKPNDKARGKGVTRAPARAPSRVIVSTGQCHCGVHNTHVLHRDFPEYCAEGRDATDGAAALERRLLQERDACPCGWHYDDLARAIEDVRAFQADLAHHGAPATGSAPVELAR